MTVQQIRRYLYAAPFRPFAGYLADGRICSVMHPDLLLLSPSGRTADIYSDLHAFETVDCLLIVNLRAYSELELRRPFLR